MPMTIDPQPARQANRQRRIAETAHQGQHIREDGDSAGQDERDGRQANGTAQPSPPMHEGVSLEMFRVPQDAHKEILCADVHIQRAADDEAGEGDAVRDALDGLACGAERGTGDPLPAPGVDDQAEGEVGGCDEGHAEINGFGVVARPAHLGDDGEEGGGCGAGAEDCC